MSKLSTVDYFVLGALAAITNNNEIPVIISQEELCSITGLKALQILISLKKLHAAELLVVIWFGDDAHIRVNKVFPELLKVTFLHQEETA